MPKRPNQKQRLLILHRILSQETDEEHGLHSAELLTRLAAYDITAERKTIYSDMDALRACGVDIIHNAQGYALASRDFELAELKLLVDAVQSSRFITRRKSDSLIAKLEGLTSVHLAKLLRRQVYVSEPVKAANESIYYNVDGIHTAIARDRTICFRYFHWETVDGMHITRHYRRDGAAYEVSPWALLWDNENYYLVGYDAQTEQLKHYRVDKMDRIAMTEHKRQGARTFEERGAAAYARRLFGMFQGEQQLVTLRCTRHIVGVLYDRFGDELTVRPDVTPDCCRVSVSVAVSPQFYGWLCGLGEEIAILAPDTAVQGYCAHLTAALRAQSTP